MEIGQIIGLVVVLLIGIFGGVMISWKSQKHTLTKWILLLILVTTGLTWIFSYGYFNGAEYYEYGSNPLGISDIANFIYTALYLSADKLVFILLLGAFYGLLSKNKGYQKLVGRIAGLFKGHEIVYAIIVSLIMTLMTSMISQTFIVLIFVPFLISVALKMGLDKLSAFSITFGSILVGLMGVLYGSEGLYWFNYYTQTEMTTGIIYRLIILIIGFMLLNFINILHIRKTKKESANLAKEDLYQVANVEDGHQGSMWTIGIMLALTFVIIILGYVDWYGIFGITAFNDFHTWLINLKINDFPIANAILGTQTNAIGLWGFLETSQGTSTTIGLGSTLLILLTIITGIISHRPLGEMMENVKDGCVKIFKCVIVYVLIMALMIVGYTTQFMPTVINLIFKGIKSFNPFLVSLVAGISHVFNTDLGLTGFMNAGYFTAKYASNIETIHLIFTTLYGFIGMFVPTSGILAIGLSYLNIEYKSWLKYIWIFVVGMLVVLLTLFTILTYL